MAGPPRQHGVFPALTPLPGIWTPPRPSAAQCRGPGSPLSTPSGSARKAAGRLVGLHTSPAAPWRHCGSWQDFVSAVERKRRWLEVPRVRPARAALGSGGGGHRPHQETLRKGPRGKSGPRAFPHSPPPASAHWPPSPRREGTAAPLQRQDHQGLVRPVRSGSRALSGCWGRRRALQGSEGWTRPP